MTDKNKICMCECHQKNKRILHKYACCSLTYEKYLNKDNTIDIGAYNKCVEEHKRWLEGKE